MSILDLNPFVLVSLACAVIYGFKKLENRFAKRLNLPPGPPSKPFIGNLLDLPNAEFWVKATEWAKEYGDIVHLNILGQDYVILNTEEASIDLLDKRSAIYSDRPTTTMLHELLDAYWFFACAPYGETWRACRRIIQEGFTTKAVREYRGIISKSTQILLQQLSSSPENFYDHILRFSSAIIIDVIYGLDVKLTDDPWVEMGEQALLAITQGATPGTFLVDAFPFLKYWPAWAWGGGFKKLARAWKKDLNDFLVLPYEAALRLMNESNRQSLISSWMTKISNKDKDSDKEILLKTLPWTAATAFTGGYETTSSAIDSFFLAMILYPNVQVKAHEELDRVIGRDRLPDFSDEEQLPYIRALCSELLRWHPIAPFGIPHRNIAEDEYRGMIIPKGSIVIGNIWYACTLHRVDPNDNLTARAITRNKNIYGENIEDLEPERFMKGGVQSPPVFGFGRRICPGRHLVNESLFSAVCSILHVFKIGRKPGSVGEIKPEQFKWTSGLAVHPEPFECSITLRFDGALELFA